MIESHIRSLPAAPFDLSVSAEEAEGTLRQRNERERRELALADRLKRVEAEKRRQIGKLQYSKGMLRDGEQELQRAKQIHTNGLLGYMLEHGDSGGISDNPKS